MSEKSISEQVDDSLEEFRRETGIWPPGRDMPAALCGDQGADQIRFSAYEYWCKARRQLSQAREKTEQADQTILKLHKNICGLEAENERLQNLFAQTPRLLAAAWSGACFAGCDLDGAYDCLMAAARTIAKEASDE